MRLVTLAITGILAVRVGHAQTPATRPSLLQIEVGDSIGLPLPDAKVEVYTLMDRAVFQEWVWVDPNDLPEGVQLLRISHPGYRTSVFSVPLRKGSRVSLRVRLGAERDTTKNRNSAQAEEVRSIGLFMEGRSTTDIIRSRQALDRDAIDRARPKSVADLLRKATGLDINVSPGEGGLVAVGASRRGGPFGCPLPVMVNGDTRHLMAFGEVNQRFTVDEVEAIELIPRLASPPFMWQRERAECGLLLVWVK